MSVSPVLDAAGRRRSPATMLGYHAGRAPRNKALRYPADPPTVEEIIAVMAPCNRLGVALIGLHAIRRPTRNEPQRTHQTVHPRGLQPPGERETGWPRLIRRAHRPRNAATNPPPQPPARQPPASQLARSRSMIAATVTLTCTSTPQTS